LFRNCLKIADFPFIFSGMAVEVRATVAPERGAWPKGSKDGESPNDPLEVLVMNEIEFIQKLKKFEKEEFEDKLDEEEFFEFVEENLQTFEKVIDLLFDMLLEYIFRKGQQQENIHNHYKALHYAITNTQYRATKLLHALNDLKDPRVIATSDLSLFYKEI